MLERKPDDDIALRYMTTKQLQQANEFITAIECCINADIKSVESSRKRQKLFYDKKQSLGELSNGKTNVNTNGMTNNNTNGAEKIREDKIRKDIPPISPKEGDETDGFKIELPNNFFEMFLDVWNNNLSNEIKAPKIKVLSDERKKKIKSIINFISKENKTIDYKDTELLKDTKLILDISKE